VAATPATRALEAAGVAHRVHRYAHDPRTASFGDEAAAALGVEAGRVYKTLVVATEPPGRAPAVVAVVPVVLRLDLGALAAALGAKRAQLADRTVAERLSGSVVGAISPLGWRRPLPTVVDAGALRWPTVFCSAGRRGLEVELDPADLIRLTGATTASLTV
jgi:Cys-tRNA(Pro)/Cys-tRNA(Cys) deacylase